MPLPRRDGQYLTALDTPEGTHYAMVLHHVSGDFCDLGALVARMHACLDDLPGDLTPVNWDLHWLVDVPLTQLEPALTRRRDVIQVLQQIGETIKTRIDALLSRQKPEYGLIHGDLHQDNVHVDPQSGFGFVDAESFGYGWRAWEIVYLVFGHLRAWDPQALGAYERRWQAFVDGYRQARALNKAECQAAPGTFKIILKIAPKAKKA